jgi:P-type Ca2+ transporter type 2C
MDDNFASIVKALLWGRAVNDAVRKFLQFQITVNITAVLLASVTAVASDKGESVLTAVQLLWVNLIMDTFAALALATDPPTRSLLGRKPDPKSAPLITLRMWKMIIGQAIYQLTVTLILHFGGEKILSHDSPVEQARMPTLVFNTFVWMQIFNAINNRRLDNKLNIFEGITRNWFFITILLIMIGGQTVIVFVGGAAFHVVPISGVEWGYSVALGALSLPVGILVRLLPDQWPRTIVAKARPPCELKSKWVRAIVSKARLLCELWSRPWHRSKLNSDPDIMCVV